jgi:tight adherence protein B
MSERQRAHADRATAREPGGDGVRGRSPRRGMSGPSKTWRRVVAVAWLTSALTVAGLGTAVVASAQETAEAPELALRRVDSTDASNTIVDFQYGGEASALDSLVVRQDGREVPSDDVTPLSDLAVAIVVDTSSSTDANAMLRAATDALEGFDLPQGLDVAVIAAGSQPAVYKRFGNGTLQDAIDRLTPGGDGAVWNGVVLAAGQLDRQSSRLPLILLVTDGNQGGTVGPDRALGAAFDVGAPVFVVGFQDGELGGDARALAERTGGAYLEADRAVEVGDLVDRHAAAIRGHYRFTFDSTVERGVTDLDLQVGEATAEASFVAGSVATGASRLVRQATEEAGGIEFLQGNLGKALGLVAALAAAMLGAFAVISIFVKDEGRLSTALRPYSDGYVAGEEEAEEDADSSFARTAFVQRAVEFTEQFAERQGLLIKVEGMLERANLPLRAGEAIFFYGAAVVVLALLIMVLSRSAAVSALALLFLVLVPPAALNFLSNRRRKTFESQLPDTLQLLSGTLRAGYSMMQGVEAVSQEVDEPMGRELRRVVTESRLGRPLEDSLDAVAERMGSKDFAWAVMAIKIQREVGGNLSELLMTVGETMTARERLRRDVRTLTAEGRISAIVLGVMPPALLGIIYMVNKEYMEVLFERTMGQVMLVGATIWAIIGFVWMNKIIKIEI